jgi:dihydroneopterin aldolase
MRRIAIERLRLPVSVGILDHELRARQPLLVSIVVELPAAELIPSADEVDQVLDYRLLRQIALDEAQTGHVNMLETFAGRIAARLGQLTGVGKVVVKVVKPHVFPDCDGASVEVSHEVMAP